MITMKSFREISRSVSRNYEILYGYDEIFSCSFYISIS